MAGYESEHTKFMRELKKKNPQMEAGQLQGYSLLWDRKVDREAQRGFQEAKVPQQGYPYQNHVGPATDAGETNKGG